MFIFTTCLLQAISPLCTTLLWSQTNAEPIIDMHLHAKYAGELGPPPLYICAPFPVWPVRDPLEDPHAWFAGLQRKPTCPSFLRSGTSDEDLMRRTLENLKSRNVTVAVTDGDLEVMEKWKQASEGRILPALPFDPESGKPSVDELRQLVKSRRVMAFAEISSQYEGIAVTDSLMEPYFALAEELDIPVGRRLVVSLNPPKRQTAACRQHACRRPSAASRCQGRYSFIAPGQSGPTCG
jgi:hypothetical protein